MGLPPRGIEWCRARAKEHGGECLDSEYAANRAKLTWRCKKGHVWQSTAYVISTGSWCKKCTFLGRVRREDGGWTEAGQRDAGWYQEIAARRGGRCLAPEYVGTNVPVEWECGKGHRWFTASTNVKEQGKWCKKCSTAERFPNASPVFDALRRRLRSRLRHRIRQCKAWTNQKVGSAVRDLGCTVPELKQRIETLFLPGMSWDNWGNGDGKWNIDHVRPLSSFDLTKREDLLKAVHYTNLQPMWWRENLSKGAKHAA